MENLLFVNTTIDMLSAKLQKVFLKPQNITILKLLRYDFGYLEAVSDLMDVKSGNLSRMSCMVFVVFPNLAVSIFFQSLYCFLHLNIIVFVAFVHNPVSLNKRSP